MKGLKIEMPIDKKNVASRKSLAVPSGESGIVNSQGKKIVAFAKDVSVKRENDKIYETEQEKKLAEAREAARREHGKAVEAQTELERERLRAEQAMLQLEQEKLRTQQALSVVEQERLKNEQANRRIAELEKQLEEAKKRPAQSSSSQSSAPQTQSEKSGGTKMAVGSIITLGTYPQDRSGTRKPIEWVVLDNDGDAVLVISRYALDSKPYNKTKTEVTWETCSLRYWLNHDFCEIAFDQKDMEEIITMTVPADKNPTFGSNSGKDTVDNVFLVSIPEANKYFSSEEARRCIPTPYADKNGAFTHPDFTVDGKAACCWWLRSPGQKQNNAAMANCRGVVNDEGNDVNRKDYTVRPAMWIRGEAAS